MLLQNSPDGQGVLTAQPVEVADLAPPVGQVQVGLGRQPAPVGRGRGQREAAPAPTRSLTSFSRPVRTS